MFSINCFWEVAFKFFVMLIRGVSIVGKYYKHVASSIFINLGDGWQIPLYVIHCLCGSNSSTTLFMEVSLLLFALADPFHEVKRKRDKKKEVL